jgi:endonuclease YncB( thermonuclease family)
MGGWGFILIAGLAAGSAAGAHAHGAMQARAAACAPDVIGSGKVAAITDGRSFVLDDGRAVRLAALEVPLPPASGEASQRAEAARAARMALEAILASQKVELRGRASDIDRYGRAVAHVDVLGAEGARRDVAQAMLAMGYARVAARVGDFACAAELLVGERAARDGRLGLWSEPHYGIVQAQSRAELLAERGRFTLVEGKVLSVRQSGGTIYVNFGRRWSDALTVTILKRNERTFTAAGLQPSALENRHVRVRGWIEERNGPRIEASRPEQIEIAERN